MQISPSHISHSAWKRQKDFISFAIVSIYVL